MKGCWPVLLQVAFRQGLLHAMHAYAAHACMRPAVVYSTVTPCMCACQVCLVQVCHTESAT
jgi:hypothetical protein